MYKRQDLGGRIWSARCRAWCSWSWALRSSLARITAYSPLRQQQSTYLSLLSSLPMPTAWLALPVVVSGALPPRTSWQGLTVLPHIVCWHAMCCHRAPSAGVFDTERHSYTGPSFVSSWPPFVPSPSLGSRDLMRSLGGRLRLGLICLTVSFPRLGTQAHCICPAASILLQPGIGPL